MIVKAIEEGWLGGAILDVFEEEPLPADSKLWRISQVIITPHTAALVNVDDVRMTSCKSDVTRYLGVGLLKSYKSFKSCTWLA